MNTVSSQSIEAVGSQSTPKYVSAPVYASAYPKAHWKQADAPTLWHCVELDADSDPVRVLCGKVKLESIVPDSSLFNTVDISCKTCLAKANHLARQGSPLAYGVNSRD